MLFQKLNSLRRKTLDNVQAKWISSILEKPDCPEYVDDDETFNELHARIQQLPDYGYDKWSTWQRGVERAFELLQFPEYRETPVKFLEIGCGDGMTGAILEQYGASVVLCDLEDWRDNRAKGLTFLQADICLGLELDSSTFDCVYSFNSFEHFLDPQKAFSEILRVCKKCGTVYLSFGPLYTSPWGLHAHRTVRIPYLQFLFSQPFIEKKLGELGIFDLGSKRSALQPLNQWRLDQFQALWKFSNCDIISMKSLTNTSHLDIVRRYPSAFQGRGLTYNDLVIEAVFVRLKKK